MKLIKLTNNIFFIFIFVKKIRNNPNKNKIKGILFPEKSIPKPRAVIVKKININLPYLFFSNNKDEKNIAKNANLCIKLPAIGSSPKKLEL